MDERPPGARAGGPIVAADRIRLAEEPVRVGVPRPAGGRAEPKVHLVRDGGVIQAIEVTCTCGEKLRIRCEYT